jgi:alanine dehydrogenase
MSQVAGVLAVQYGAQYLQKKYNGRGVTLGVIEGTGSARVVVIGGGVVGTASAVTAAGMGCRVKLFDINQTRVDEINKEMQEYLGPNLGKNFEAVVPNGENYDKALRDANLVVGAVLVAGAKAPEVVSEQQVKDMKDGTVIVDVSIDQGGCIWGSKATTHSDPIYEIYGKIYCSVANMPGQVSRQSTMALTNATLPYLKMIAGEGAEALIKKSLSGNGRFARGLNTYKGYLTYEAVAHDLGCEDKYKALEELV